MDPSGRIESESFMRRPPGRASDAHVGAGRGRAPAFG
jgi:hypothetical protein